MEHASYASLSEKWVSACDLKHGDKVLLSDGTLCEVEGVSCKKLSEPETTYNLEVADFHTYYVSDACVLVHNADCGLTRQQMNQYKREILSGKDVHLNSKNDALQLIKTKFRDFAQETAHHRSAQGWHFDLHPINGSLNSVEHINIYSKAMRFSVHILWG